MTEQMAIEYLLNRYLVVGSPVNPPKEECEKQNAVIDMAIQALEKQSMVNEILNELKQYRAIGTVEELQALKEKSVKSVATGKWIDTEPEYHNGYYRNAHVCSNCHDYYTTEYDEMKFCPNCGAEMIEIVSDLAYLE